MAPQKETHLQMIVCHARHGHLDEDQPYFDLGVFVPAQAERMAAYLTALALEFKLDNFKGNVVNIAQAWGCNDFRCWLMPLTKVGPNAYEPDDASPAWAWGETGLVQLTAEEDPRYKSPAPMFGEGMEDE